MPSPIAGLIGTLQNARGAISSLSSPGLGVSQSIPLPFYSFEVWDDEAPATDLTGEILEATDGKLTLRLPPSSYQRERPYRSDVQMDLSGQPVVFDGGLGLGRCSIRGTHGVGEILTESLVAVYGEEDPRSPGYLEMRALEGFFEEFAALNQTRIDEGDDPYRLVFSIRDGSWTEPELHTRWIQLLSLPTIERNAARPLEWSYSLSWWDLGEAEAVVAYTDTLLDPPSPLAAGNALGGLQGQVAGLMGQYKLRQDWSTASKLEALANDMSSLRNEIDAPSGRSSTRSWGSTIAPTSPGSWEAQRKKGTMRAQGLGVISGITGTINQVANAATGILKATNPATLKDDLDSRLRTTMLNIREVTGAMSRWSTTSGLRVAPTRDPRSSLTPGMSLQQVASLRSGSQSGWIGIAAKNQLRYPFTET